MTPISRPRNQPLVIVGFGNRQKRHVASAIEGADLAAQPQAVEILQAKRHDNKIVIAFGGMKQRLGWIGFDIDSMFGR